MLMPSAAPERDSREPYESQRRVDYQQLEPYLPAEPLLAAGGEDKAYQGRRRADERYGLVEHPAPGEYPEGEKAEQRPVGVGGHGIYRVYHALASYQAECHDYSPHEHRRRDVYGAPHPSQPPLGERPVCPEQVDGHRSRDRGQR